LALLAAAPMVVPFTEVVGCPGTFTLNEVTVADMSNKKSGQSTRTVCAAIPFAGTVICVFPKITPRAGGTGLILNSFVPETVLPVLVVAEAVNVTVFPVLGLNI